MEPDITFPTSEELTKHIQAMLRQFGEDIELRVGFLEGSTYPDGTPVAQVAALNEFGHNVPVGKTGMGPVARVVARPFFSGMIAQKSPDWPRRLENLYRHHQGDMHAVMQAFGESIAQDLQMAIIEFNDPPDKDVTIARKGFAGGAQATLQDTKHMLFSVSYEVNGERFQAPVNE